MAMGSREQRQRQEELWVATAALARPASHPFYDRLNRLLDECQFDEFVESLSKPFYAKTLGRPGLTPGIYFRLLMVGYFEGIDSERGMAWRAADSLGIRAFLRIALDEIAPDHSMISRTRRLICGNTPARVRVVAGNSGRAWIIPRPDDRDATAARLMGSMMSTNPLMRPENSNSVVHPV